MIMSWTNAEGFCEISNIIASAVLKTCLLSRAHGINVQPGPWLPKRQANSRHTMFQSQGLRLVGKSLLPKTPQFLRLQDHVRGKGTILCARLWSVEVPF